MGPKLTKIVNIIKESQLTFEERLGVVQDLGIIDKNEKIDPVDTLNGYKKIHEFLEAKKTPDIIEVDFNNIVHDLFVEFNTRHGYKNIKPIVEFTEKEKGATVERGEGESDPEFLLRKHKAEKDQQGKEDDFAKMNDGKKKGESKPLARALRSKGLSQNELADKLDMNKSTVSRLKTGKRKPSFDTLKQLSNVLGNVDNLFPELN
jgi:DNA-binding Xre family transcriptional regulator